MNSKNILALSRLLWIAVWVGLAMYLALTLWLGFVGLVYPYQLDYGEGIVLWFARQIAQGHSIYKGLSGFPYASSNYPPVSMLLAAAMMSVLGDGYTAGRLLNFASALIVAALIYRIVRAETRDVRAGMLAALFFIGSTYIYHWVPLFRADLVGLAFTLAGVYAIGSWEKRQPMADNRQQTRLVTRQYGRSVERPSVATLLFLLALYTKHTLIAAPIAAFFAIFLRDKRNAIAFAAVLGAIGGGIYLALDYATHGAFTFGLIESNATVFLPGQLAALVLNFAITFPILLLLAAWEWIARVSERQFGVLEAYAITALATSAFAGRVGAWENYFFEAIAAACIFTGFALRRLSSPLATRPLALTLPILLLAQLGLMWSDHDPRIAASLIAEDLPANQRLAAVLAHTRGTVISEDMGALVTSGKEVAYYTFQYSSLARSGKWDQGWELNGLRDGIFPFVVLEHGTREDVDHYRRFTREFVSALDRHYARVQTIGKYEVYVPAALEHLRSANFGDAIAMIGWSAQLCAASSQSVLEPNSNKTPPCDDAETLKPGNLQLTIVWQANRAMPRRYTAFAHLEDAAGSVITQDDHEPRGGIYPTTRWALGEMVREVYPLKLPTNLPAGKYVLRVGWYDTETDERLGVAGSMDDTVIIAMYE